VIEASPSGSGTYHIVGQVEPGGPGYIEVRQLGTRRVPCDQWGRFEVDSVSNAPLSLRWTPADDALPAVGTVWFRL
jgi:hypothetical protein